MKYIKDVLTMYVSTNFKVYGAIALKVPMWV